MRIGTLARHVGVETSAVRFYESEGLLPEPARTSSGYREYDDGDVERLTFIRSARVLGLGLDEIGDILAFRDRGEVPCGHVVDLLDAQRQAIDRRIVELQETRAEVDRLVELAATLPPMEPSDACVCHIIDLSPDAKASTASRR